MTNWKIEKGARVFLCREIVEPACDDHPAFLMGIKGEAVDILEIKKEAWREYPILVQGTTNKNKPWYVKRSDIMFTKPIF